MDMSSNETILRIKDVVNRTGLPRSSIYEKIDMGDFPRPINLGKRAVGWASSEIDTWILSRIKVSRDKVSQN